MSRSKPTRLRRPLIVGCLGAALLVVTALGYEAVTAARAQRRTVEGVLRNYAELAAEQYALNVGVVLDYEWFFPVFGLLETVAPGTPFPDPDREIKGQRGAYRLGDLATRFFWLDGQTGELAVEPVGAAAAGGAGARPPGSDREPGIEAPAATLRDADPGIEEPAATLRDPDPGIEELAATLRQHAETRYDDGWYHAAIIEAAAGGALILVYRRAPPEGGEPDGLYGFEAAPGALDTFLRLAVHRYPLLPESLTNGAGADELVRVRLLDREGQTLFETGPAGDRLLGAGHQVGEHLGGLRVEAAIPPSSAARLVVGGLPYSRLPLILGMLAITVVLLGVGVALLRREQELVDLREQFVAGASHELRTPLAQIRMFAETLRLERVRSGEERRRSLEILDREARRLAFLVENLLQFSSAARGPRRFAAERTDVGRLVADVVEGFAPLAAARGARLAFVDAGGVIASADRGMLRQVILNLLDNAVKYGPAGQTVAVEATACGGGAVISVTDRGPGVVAAERQRIWERFWRGAASDGISGTGIGLALVKELVEMHGGSVAVEAVAGGGSRFVVRLPGTAGA